MQETDLDDTEVNMMVPKNKCIALVMVSGYWYTGVCVRMLISHVRQVQDKSVCVRSQGERYVHLLLH